jgi:hypothetical protein
MSNIKEKYLYIEPQKAKGLLSEIKNMKPSKIGSGSLVYLIDEYAILETEEINRRNVLTHDDDLAYLDELAKTLMDLSKKHVGTIPILGYYFDSKNNNEGKGFLIQERAKGEELYDDEIMKFFYTGWKQNNSESKNFKNNVDPKKYILSRTSQVAEISQKHFDKFIKDILIILEQDILVDFKGKSNFFYDKDVGFQFIDLDSHTDYKYGLEKNRPDDFKKVSEFGFVACHFAPGTEILPLFALNDNSISDFTDDELGGLVDNNKIIFQKSKTAMLNNNVPEDLINESLNKIKFFGIDQ